MENEKFTVRDFLQATKELVISDITIDANYSNFNLFDWFEEDNEHDKLFQRAIKKIKTLIEKCTNHAILDMDFCMKINSSDTVSVWIGKMYIEMETDLTNYGDSSWFYEFQKDIDNMNSREERQETRSDDRLFTWLNS